jgi:DNA-binding CsgD family transcriptional regulator
VISTGSIEPVDGGPTGHEPVIGWRVWVLANNCLFSIAKNASWRPGENQAECLAGHERDIPVPSCHCGFWALDNPVSAIQLAAQVECGPRIGSGFAALDPQRTVAVGLIQGYGAIAVHGWEGFRAEFASVTCIFSDAPEPLLTEPVNVRRTVAEEYGVPCITLDAAISIGFLQEMGVRPPAVEHLKAWIGAGRPLPRTQAPSSSITISPRRTDGEATELTRRELQIARLLVKGLGNTEIARSTGLNERAVDFRVARLMEKIGLMSRREKS